MIGIASRYTQRQCPTRSPCDVCHAIRGPGSRHCLASLGLALLKMLSLEGAAEHARPSDRHALSPDRGRRPPKPTMTSAGPPGLPVLISRFQLAMSPARLSPSFLRVAILRPWPSESALTHGRSIRAAQRPCVGRAADTLNRLAAPPPARHQQPRPPFQPRPR